MSVRHLLATDVCAMTAGQVWSVAAALLGPTGVVVGWPSRPGGGGLAGVVVGGLALARSRPVA